MSRPCSPGPPPCGTRPSTTSRSRRSSTTRPRARRCGASARCSGGAVDAAVPSHVYTNNSLTGADLHSLRSDGAVGDVCTVFLRADGTWQGIRMNDHGSGPDPAQLARLPRRLLVAAGTRKALPLRAALRAGVATDLVVDEVTAASMLSLS